jgi:uncharacterized protein
VAGRAVWYQDNYAVANAGAVNRAGWTIDAFHFAESGGVLEGRLESAELPRLAELAVSPLQPFEARVAGLRSPRGKAGLELWLRGRITVTCQRCLQALDLALEPHAGFELERSEAQADAAGLDDDEVWDAVVGSERFDLIQLCEDELLLAVPYAPMHEVCEPAGATAAGDRVSPFAALAQLKRG